MRAAGEVPGVLHPAQLRDRPPRPVRAGVCTGRIITLLRHPPTASALGYATAAGILSSAVPFLADLLALRRVPARFFGVFMSVNPVLAALVGLLILDQSLGWAKGLAITTIVIANTVGVLTADRRRP
jgi:inner membrane transporter RhtA